MEYRAIHRTPVSSSLEVVVARHATQRARGRSHGTSRLPTCQPGHCHSHVRLLGKPFCMFSSSVVQYIFYCYELVFFNCLFVIFVLFFLFHYFIHSCMKYTLFRSHLVTHIYTVCVLATCCGRVWKDDGCRSCNAWNSSCTQNEGVVYCLVHVQSMHVLFIIDCHHFMQYFML